MKKKITFAVKSDIIFDDYWDFTFENIRYSPDVDCGKMKSITATYQTSIKKLKKEIESDSWILIDEIIYKLIKNLRIVEANLSFYGKIEIEQRYFQVLLIPETKYEQSFLKKKNIDLSIHESMPNRIPIDFSMFVRSIISSADLYKYDSALSFFHHGQQLHEENRNREAFYSFYFFIEHMFSNGKYRRNDIVNEFMKSDILINAIKKSY